MDAEILDAMDCKKCHWWSDRLYKCNKPADIDCPEGVRPPQQEVADTNYSVLS